MSDVVTTTHMHTPNTPINMSSAGGGSSSVARKHRLSLKVNNVIFVDSTVQVAGNSTDLSPILLTLEMESSLFYQLWAGLQLSPVCDKLSMERVIRWDYRRRRRPSNLGRVPAWWHWGGKWRCLYVRWWMGSPAANCKGSRPPEPSIARYISCVSIS